MTSPTHNIIAFTSSVRSAQEQRGSRKAYARVEANGGWSDTVDGNLQAFIASRDSFYLGTASSDGQPYIQHRGGPAGFLKVLDKQRLAFADFSGNRQYISVGNLDENDKAFIFLMDYPNKRRIKIWGTARYVEDDPDLLAQLQDPAYGGRLERAVVFHVEAWDVNCPQHITPRFDGEALAAALRPYQERIDALEAELSALRAEHQPPPGK